MHISSGHQKKEIALHGPSIIKQCDKDKSFGIGARYANIFSHFYHYLSVPGANFLSLSMKTHEHNTWKVWL